jgi:hypothetical protein
MMTEQALDVSYILPIKASRPVVDAEWVEYLRWISANAREVLVVDSSDAEIFGRHEASWGQLVRHVPLQPDLATPMGKVGNVMTGVRLARFEKIIIADDDVRYDMASLAQVVRSLDDADVVRPQNYFDPLPWHARWDSGRMLLNRMMGGDWPGTLGVRRGGLLATDGYDGNAMFENLELVRTVIAAGGTERVLLDAFVLRRPSSTPHFWSQRIRQAYDEFARPHRMLWQLATLPLVVALIATGKWRIAVLLAVCVVGVAEAGRRRSGGARFFPASTSLFAPVWLLERAICSWIALVSRVCIGGVRYRGRTLHLAANSMRVLKERHARLQDRPIMTAAHHIDRYRSA